MPKILFVTPGCFDKGGISRYSRYQIRAFRELYGEENVRVFSLLGPDQNGFENPIAVDWYGSGPTLKGKASLVGRVAREVLRWRPDVVHIAHINFSGMLVPIAKLGGAKSVLNTYGLEVWSNPSRDATWGLQNADFVLSDCHSTRQYLEHESKLRAMDTGFVIWDCVDLEQFHPHVGLGKVVEKYGIPDPATHLNVVTLGRLSHEAMHKGYDRLLEVFAHVVKEVPTARLVFAGRGNARDFLEERANQLGISYCTVFTGSVDDGDLASIYRAAAVFSLVSDRGLGRGEGIPLTPLEAMSCGVPIIVGNQDGSGEAIDCNLNGFSIDPFDLVNHAQKLVLLLKDRTIRNQMGVAAVKVAHQRFSFVQFREGHAKMYEQIVPKQLV